jgi:oxalate decarboxylase/phosphoglucose isomerase-like protein (cupin superfamily)
MNNVPERVEIVSAAPALDVFGAALSVLSDGNAIPLVLGEQAVPPGYGVPQHVHEADDEVFYVLEGELTVSSQDGEKTIGAGTAVTLPRGVPHGFRNEKSLPARLVVLLPDTQGLQMFRQFDAAGRHAAPVDVASVAAQYGVRFI